MNAKVFRIVDRKSPPVDQPTIDTLKKLLTQAENGDLIGLAFVALHKTYNYRSEITGQARHSPTFTRGMIRELDDKLAKLIPLLK
jgi:hypothetical protein